MLVHYQKMVGDICSGEVVTDSPFVSIWISNDASRFTDFLFLTFLQNQYLGNWIRQCSPKSEFFLHFPVISLFGEAGVGLGLGVAGVWPVALMLECVAWGQLMARLPFIPSP